jgi:hypothetical protein
LRVAFLSFFLCLFCQDDAVFVIHAGFAITPDGEKQIDANPPKSEDDPTPEPLEVFVGMGHVLAGMER